MASRVDSSIVRVFNDRGPVGCGYLIEPTQVVTCAHVVRQAISPAGTAEQQVQIDFPMVAEGSKIPARVWRWDAASLNADADIALLEPLEKLPAGAEPAPIATDVDFWAHDFRAFGFPQDFQNGVWASGRVLDRDAVGWLLIEDVKNTGYFVQPGFSGTPVWDDVLNCVIGVVVAVDLDPTRRTAFVIPAERLVRLINSMRLGMHAIDGQVLPTGGMSPPSPVYLPQLEHPKGVVRLNSPFYIERNSDRLLAKQMAGHGTITTIYAGRQTGKTSLLIRGVQDRKLKNCKVVFIDFQRIPEEQQRSLDRLLQHISAAVSRDLKIDDRVVKEIWGRSWGPADKFDEFMIGNVLAENEGPVLLAMDEVDKLLERPFKNDFFGLVRGWNTQQAYNPVWQNLNIVMVISSHPLLLIENYRQSPFNVGMTIRLQDFTPDQVGRLNWLHGSPLQPANLPEMMELFGGHPFLTRMALYWMVQEKMAWRELAAQAESKTGPFGDHLQYYWQQLNENADLSRSMREVIRREQCPDERMRYRLLAAGLIRQDGDRCRPRCGLYRSLI